MRLVLGSLVYKKKEKESMLPDGLKLVKISLSIIYLDVFMDHSVYCTAKFLVV